MLKNTMLKITPTSFRYLFCVYLIVNSPVHVVGLTQDSLKELGSFSHLSIAAISLFLGKLSFTCM